MPQRGARPVKWRRKDNGFGAGREKWGHVPGKL
jgi:hypothetical protein